MKSVFENDTFIIVNFEEKISSVTVSTFSPPIDIYENNNGIFIDIELPGIDKEHIKITLSQGKLIVKGEKHFNKEYQKHKFYLLERPYGIFNRIFALPSNADIDKIDARLKDGILKISIPYKNSMYKKVIVDENNS